MRLLKWVFLTGFLVFVILLISGGSEEEKSYPVLSASERDIKTCLYYFGEDVDYGTMAAYDILILNEINGNAENIRRIKEINPDAKVLLYTMSMDLPNSNHYVFKSNPDIHPSLQELYTDIDSNHQDYFLTGRDDKRVYLSFYVEEYAKESDKTKEKLGYCMDPRTGWSDYYVEYIKSWMDQGIYDGVYSDAARCYEEMKDEGSAVEWKKPGNEQQWDNSVKNMLSNVEKSIDSDLMTVYNNGYNKWIDVYDARFIEWWIQYEKKPLGGDYWLMFVQSAEETVNTGKSLCVAQYGYGKEQRIYGLASFLLISNDHSYYYFNDGGSIDYAKPLEWYPEYELQIGEPAGAYYVKDGVYQRDFTNGKVLVNPGNDNVETELDRTYYSDGEGATKVKLSPRTGKILLKEINQNI